jgi:hypothetical protein
MSSRGDSDIFWGAPQGLHALVQIDGPPSGSTQIRMHWTLRDEQGAVQMIDTSDIYTVEPDVTTLRLELWPPEGELAAGPHELLVDLQVVEEEPGLVSDGEYRDVASQTSDIRLFDPADTPIVDPPVEEASGSPVEPLGQPYSPLDAPDPTTAELIVGVLNLIVISKTGESLPNFWPHRTAQREFNDLVRETAVVRHDFPDDGVDVRWRNRPRRGPGGGGVRLHYDRAVVTTRVPDHVTIVNDDGADYQLHDDEAGMNQVTWIHTDVDKGIEPNARTIPRTGPSGVQELKLGVDGDEAEQVEVTSTLQLELGPLRGRVTEPPRVPIDGPIEEFDHVYDYEGWQADPDAAYWMTLGVDRWSSQVTVSPIDADDGEGGDDDSDENDATIFETGFDDLAEGSEPDRWAVDERNSDFEIFEVQSGGAASTTKKLRLKGGSPFQEGGTEDRYGSRPNTYANHEVVSTVEWYWKKQNKYDSAEGYGPDTSHGPNVHFWNADETPFCHLRLGSHSHDGENPLALGIRTGDELEYFPETIEAGEFSRFSVAFDFADQTFTVTVDGDEMGTYEFLEDAERLYRIAFKVGGWGVNADSEVDEVRVTAEQEG